MYYIAQQNLGKKTHPSHYKGFVYTLLETFSGYTNIPYRIIITCNFKLSGNQYNDWRSIKTLNYFKPKSSFIPLYYYKLKFITYVL